MDRWFGKVAVVTGASSGIGAAIAERLVEDGMQVVGFARRVERVEQLSKSLDAKRGKLYARKVDLTKEEEIKAAFAWTTEHVGPVACLINNAGVMIESTLIDGDAEKWRAVLDTNVLGLCVASREAVSIMRKHGIKGHVIHMNSITGHAPIYIPKTNVYGASKYAVTNLTEMLRQELRLAQTKIKVTSISPGVVLTEMLGKVTTDEVKNVISVTTMLTAKDVADSVAYALSTPPHVQIQELMIRHVEEPF